MIELGVIVLCLLLNGIFAAFEMAFVSVPKSELYRLLRAGNRLAERMLALRENPERTLSLVQIGITLVGAISAAVGGAGAAESLQPFLAERLGVSEGWAEFLAIAFVVVPLTFLSVVVGEILPKSIALKRPTAIALFGVRWIAIADRILSPAVTALEWSTRTLLRIFFPKTRHSSPPPEGGLEIERLPQDHRQAIVNLARLERRRVGEILVPWNEVSYIRSTDSAEDLTTIVFASGHTRLPVFDGQRVIGLLHTKEFLALRETGSGDWLSLVREPTIVRPANLLLPTFRLLQRRRQHMAVVASPEDVPLGIVTLEDIFEEIWGDVFDEDDDSRLRGVFVRRMKRKVGGIR